VLEDQAQPSGPPTARTDVGLEDRKGRESAGEGRDPRGGALNQLSNKSRQRAKQVFTTSIEEENKSQQTPG